jgi:SAM-dependent methyltransferase
MSSSAETFQISVEAAEAYEAKFVPALFAEWAPLLVDAARVAPGHTVLDVACGTGVVARQAAPLVGERGKVVGVDLNPAMLTVARRLRPDIEWREGDVAALPFPDEAFDAVLCQSALMFFPDVPKALGEMGRVATAHGTIAVQVWGSLSTQPGYGPFVEVAARHAGPEAVSLLGTYWALGDLDRLSALFDAAGLVISETRTHTGTARFASIDEMVRTEVESTPLVDRLSDETYSRILADARKALGRFCTDTGRLNLPIAGHLITARRR